MSTVVKEDTGYKKYDSNYEYAIFGTSHYSNLRKDFYKKHEIVMRSGCTICDCICDEEKNSDRYFNMNNSTSDIESN